MAKLLAQWKAIKRALTVYFSCPDRALSDYVRKIISTLISQALLAVRSFWPQFFLFDIHYTMSVHKSFHSPESMTKKFTTHIKYISYMHASYNVKYTTTTG